MSSFVPLEIKYVFHFKCVGSKMFCFPSNTNFTCIKQIYVYASSIFVLRPPNVRRGTEYAWSGSHRADVNYILNEHRWIFFHPKYTYITTWCFLLCTIKSSSFRYLWNESNNNILVFYFDDWQILARKGEKNLSYLAWGTLILFYCHESQKYKGVLFYK